MYPLLVASENVSMDLAISCAALIGVLLISAFFVRRFKRKYDPRVMGGPTDMAGLSIDEMEAMHDAGMISEDEFKIMRRSALGLAETASKPKENDE
jgi:hypothetical protein